MWMPRMSENPCPDLTRRVELLESTLRKLDVAHSDLRTTVVVLEKEVSSVPQLQTRLDSITETQHSLEMELNNLIHTSERQFEFVSERFNTLSSTLDNLRAKHDERLFAIEASNKRAMFGLALGLLSFLGGILTVVLQFGAK